MSKTLNMSVPLAQRRANIVAGKPWRNTAWGSYTAQNERAVYYVETSVLRRVGWADQYTDRPLGHQGWFTDRDFQDYVMRGVVHQLPARAGAARYVAGYHYNGGDDTGATLFFDTLHDDKADAARMADEHARIAADRECDWQDQERARLAAEEAEEARLQNLADCHPPLWVEV